MAGIGGSANYTRIGPLVMRSVAGEVSDLVDQYTRVL